MSVTLEKVTNIGIKLTDGHVVPAIRAVLSGVDGNTGMSQEEVRDLMYEIYTKSTGAVTGVSYAVNDDILSADTVNLPDMNVYYGDDTGFKLHLRVENYNHVTYVTQYIYTGELFYKGASVTGSYVYSGYAPYEVGYLVLFTDDDYNLITGFGADSFQLLLDSAPGVGVSNGIPVCAVIPDQTFVSRLSSKIIQTSTTNIKDGISNEIDPADNIDPYNPEGDEGTTPGGGGGNHDLDSDDIDIPSLPGLSAVDTGFITLFNPSLSELQALADYLWSPLFDLDTVKKLFADPMDVFLGLSIVPVAVPNGGPKTVKVAGISTGVTMTTAARQYVEVNCESITINEYWGAYLDYDPYTKAELYLPYIGTHPIAIDDIMGKTISIIYHVDILSGACVAYVKCGSSVLYTFIGQCSSSIPINRSDWTNVINGALNIATAIGTMVATGGASAPMSSGSAAEAGAAASETAAKEAAKKAAMIKGASNIASTAVNVMKPSIEKSGAVSGTGGMMAIQKPYLIITRPRQAVPSNQKHYMGYPSFITTYISALSGYTEMEYVHLEGIPATDTELGEIESLLKGGVYL